MLQILINAESLTQWRGSVTFCNTYHGYLQSMTVPSIPPVVRVLQ